MCAKDVSLEVISCRGCEGLRVRRWWLSCKAVASGASQVESGLKPIDYTLLCMYKTMEA